MITFLLDISGEAELTVEKLPMNSDIKLLEEQQEVLGSARIYRTKSLEKCQNEPQLSTSTIITRPRCSNEFRKILEETQRVETKES